MMRIACCGRTFRVDGKRREEVEGAWILGPGLIIDGIFHSIEGFDLADKETAACVRILLKEMIADADARIRAMMPCDGGSAGHRTCRVGHADGS